jgi:hypothetical protein
MKGIFLEIKEALEKFRKCKKEIVNFFLNNINILAAM